jgi:hypothetical protein
MPASKGADRGRAIHGFGPDFKALAPGCGGMAGAARRETGVTTKTLWHQGGFRRRRRKLRFCVPSCLGGSRNPPSLPGSCSPWPPSDAFRNIHRAREGRVTTKTRRHQGGFRRRRRNLRSFVPSCLGGSRNPPRLSGSWLRLVRKHSIDRAGYRTYIEQLTEPRRSPRRHDGERTMSRCRRSAPYNGRWGQNRAPQALARNDEE